MHHRRNRIGVAQQLASLLIGMCIRTVIVRRAAAAVRPWSVVRNSTLPALADRPRPHGRTGMAIGMLGVLAAVALLTVANRKSVRT